MATFNGVITSLSPIIEGVSKNNRAWRRIDAVLTYDNFKPEYPKAILFSVMNDNIDKFNLRLGKAYEVEVDFSVREYNGKSYMSASAWKATPTQPAPQPQPAPAQDGGLPF